MTQLDKPKRNRIMWLLVGGAVLTAIALQAAQVIDPVDPAETLRRRGVDRQQRNEHMQRARAAAASMTALRDTLRDPDSLRWETVTTDQSGNLVCMEYRARNGFGGVNREFAVMAKGRLARTPAVWNAQCVRALFDLTASANDLIKLRSE